MTTEAYNAMIASEAAYNDDSMNLDKLNAADKAREAFYRELKIARERFEALPDDDFKSSAIENAYDTEGTETDELYWYQIAYRSYDV